ncbi:MAG: hypothetical protein KAT05_12665, partial [Spirochaetes bacterium]|nr:hypothetical protein [Spirochaetota bacterium]
TIFNDNDLILYSNIVILIIIGYLSLIRLKNDNKPLRYDKIFLNYSKKSLNIIIGIIFIIIYTLFIASFFATHNEILGLSFLNLFVSIPIITIFYIIFIKFSSNREELLPTPKKENYIKSLILTNKKWVIIISILAALIGMYCLNTTSELVYHNKEDFDKPQYLNRCI